MCQCLNFVINRRAGEMDERGQQRTVAFVDGLFPQLMEKIVEVVKCLSEAHLVCAHVVDVPVPQILEEIVEQVSFTSNRGCAC